MGRKRTLSVVAALWLSATGGQASEGLLRDFAVCTGQFSAAMEHAWLTRDRHAERYRERRSDFIDVLDAITPEGQERDAFEMRVAAKLAFAELLTQASFGRNADLSARAKSWADDQIRLCDLLIL